MGRVVEFPASNGEERQRLLAELQRVRQEIAALDLEEPADMDSEAYEAWGDRHEELEDQVDDLMDRLEELGQSSWN